MLWVSYITEKAWTPVTCHESYPTIRDSILTMVGSDVFMAGTVITVAWCNTVKISTPHDMPIQTQREVDLTAPTHLQRSSTRR